MRKRIGLRWIGAIVAICFGSWMACNNDTGPSTVPEAPAVHAPAMADVAASSTTIARVTETAALTDDIPPWHDCLNDVSGVWQEDDGRRCVAIQYLNTVTGWGRECGHNRAYFPNPDWQCCVDDGLGQCVPGSERPYTAPPGEPPDQEPDPGVWIYGTSPSKETELCEGDYIHAIGIRRSNSRGELRGSVYLVDPELARRVDLEETPDTFPYSPIEGPFRFAEGEDAITTYALDEKKIGRCPDCGEKRNVVLGIKDLIYTEDDSGGAEPYRIGDPFRFQVRKATDELCLPE